MVNPTLDCAIARQADRMFAASKRTITGTFGWVVHTTLK
jgi:hypothetical protein